MTPPQSCFDEKWEIHSITCRRNQINWAERQFNQKSLPLVCLQSSRSCLILFLPLSVIIYPYLPRRISSQWQFQRNHMYAVPLISMWHIVLSIHIPFKDLVHPCCPQTVRGNNKGWILFCPYWAKSYSVACPAGNNTKRNPKKKRGWVGRERNKGFPFSFSPLDCVFHILAQLPHPKFKGI